MTSRDSFEDDLSCPVCCEVFINPVVLSCSHSICEGCVHRFWESKTLRECPVCRRRSSSDHPPVNLVLRNLCETYRKRLCRKSSSKGGNICSLHNEKLKVFCLDDDEPVCLVCRDSRKHTNHRFCLIEEAALDKKEILKDALQYLEEHRIDFALWLFDHDDKFLKSNAEVVERQIKEEFEELHKFLRDEEAARVTALREEEEQKNQKLEEMSRQISFLSCTITDAEEQMNADDVSFLQNFKATLESARYVPSPADSRPKEITNLSNHLNNLKLRVLQKMQENFGPTSCFNISQSHIQSDLAARPLSDHPEECNKYEHFQRDGRKGANLFRDLQQFKPKAHPVGATNVFPTEPTNNLRLIHRRLPLSQISQSPLTTSINFGHTSVVDQPPVKLVFRWKGRGEPPLELLSRARRCGALREFSESS